MRRGTPCGIVLPFIPSTTSNILAGTQKEKKNQINKCWEKSQRWDKWGQEHQEINGCCLFCGQWKPLIFPAGGEGCIKG